MGNRALARQNNTNRAPVDCGYCDPKMRGMEAFNILRAKHRANRDKAIATAREEYEASLTRIATLEQDLLGRNKPQTKTISSCIESVIPSDRPFNTGDIFASLEALDPRRALRKRSIDNHISRLRDKGLVRRLQKAHGIAGRLHSGRCSSPSAAL